MASMFLKIDYREGDPESYAGAMIEARNGQEVMAWRSGNDEQGFEVPVQREPPVRTAAPI